MLKKLGLYFLVSIFLASCGGGGSSTSSSSLSISGRVIDGYIKGALVCLDVNGNGLCDSGEPSSTTDANGNYSLSYNGSTVGMHLLTSIPSSASDADYNGQTLAQAGVLPYTMMAPAPTSNSTNTFITPLSTLVSTNMLMSGITSASTSQSQVITNLGLNSNLDLLNTDYVSTGNTSQHSLAQVVSASIGAAQNQLLTNSTYTNIAGSASTLAGQIASQYIVPSVSAAVIDPTTGNLSSAIGNASTVITTASNTSTNIASSNAANLSVVANLYGKVATNIDLQTLLTQGLIVVNNTEEYYYDSNNNITQNTDNKSLKVTLTKIVGNVNTNLINEFVHSNGSNNTGTWFNEYQAGTDYDLTSTGWVAEDKNNNGAGGVNTPTFSGNCMLNQSVSVNGVGQVNKSICAAIYDVSGTVVSKLIPSVCSDGTPTSNCSTATFPANSYALNIVISYPQDTYRTYVSDKQFTVNGTTVGFDGYGSGFNPQTTTLDSYLATSVSTSQVQFMGNNCNIAFEILTYNSGVGGTIKFTQNTSTQGCTNTTYDFTNGTTETFSIKNVNNQQIALFVTPAIYKLNNPQDNTPYQTFVALLRNGDTNQTIWQGNFFPAGYEINYPFTGAVKVGSRSILDTYLSLTQQTPYPN